MFELTGKPKGKPKRGTRRNGAWLILALVVLAGTFTVYQVVLAPPVPPTAPPDGHVYPSPDGRYFVVENSIYSRMSVTDGRRTDEIDGMVMTTFKGWAANSRYAIFYTSNQYGITASLLFDTQAWTLSSYGDCPPSMSPCNRGNPVGSNGHWLLVGDGSILDLDDELREIARLPVPDQHNLTAGSWSPDTSHLVFVLTQVGEYDSANYALPHVYLADGMGKNAIEVGQLGQYAAATEWAWDEDGQQVTITSEVRLAQSWTTLYELDIATGRLTQLP